MQLDNEKMLFDAIQKAYKILIALPKNPNADTLGSALALSAFLKKLNKEVDVVCEQKDFGSLSFLPGLEKVKQDISFFRSFVISINTEKTKINEISYHKTVEEKVDINIKPKSGTFAPSDVSFGTEQSSYDLLVCVDTPSLENLGDLYSKNAEMFFDTPKANIDNHAANENYGNINVIDITASSTAEILLELLKNYEETLIDEDIATALLAGIIGSTNSFQHASTTPNSFLRASELISYGARQQEIVLHLFKTKSLAMLKLWGRAMARIQNISEFGAVYAVVNQQDIEKSEANEDDVFNVVVEFSKNISGYKVLFFAVERQEQVDLFMHTNPNIKLSEFVNYFGGQMVSPSVGKAILRERKIADIETVLRNVLSELKPRLGL